MLNNPMAQGAVELWFVRRVAKERGIGMQAALTLILKNSAAFNRRENERGALPAFKKENPGLSGWRGTK